MNLSNNIELKHNNTGENISIQCSKYDTSDESSELLLFGVQDVISTVVLPIFLLTGIPGNLLTIAVIIRQRKTITYTGVSLLFVSVADLITLLSHYLLDWIVKIAGISYSSLGRSVCLTISFFTFSSSAFSPWGLVALTAERVVSVVRPFDAKRLFTPKLSVVLLTTMASVMSVQCGYLFIDDLSERDELIHGVSCSVMQVDYEGGFTFAWTVLFTSLSFCLPCVLLCTGNSVLLWKLYKRRKVPSSGPNATNRTKREHRLYILIIMLNVLYLISQLPFPVLMIFAEDINFWITEAFCSNKFLFRVGLSQLVYHICNMFAVLNPSLNYLLYFVSSPGYRQEIKAFFQCQTAGRNNIFAQ